ncbi:myoD family inhibitor isoform 2-T2 [Rhinophrynus dorsalis]
MSLEAHGSDTDPSAPSLDPVEQGEVSEQPNLNLPIKEAPEDSVVTEPPHVTCSSTMMQPVTQVPQIKKGTQYQPQLGTPPGSTPQNRETKKTSTQPRLEKQSSRTSSKGLEPPHLPPESQEDCCVHCTLALLFCQFLSLCNLILDVLTCGSCSADSAGFCCSCCSMGGCPDCSDSCGTDCGIVDACCESADCLEICMECCGLCFSS